MQTDEYVKNVLRTESSDITKIKERFNQTDVIRLMHSVVGMCTETGEMQDQLKKHLFYGKELDRTNLIEELGDLLWYVGVACAVLDVPMSEVMRINIEKLQKRYPGKFTEEAALNRNLEQERLILEQR